MNDKKSIHEWCKEYDVEIMDNDGFPKWDSVLYTEDEFLNGIAMCTVKMNVNSKLARKFKEV